MARTINGKFIPTDIISKSVIGTDINGKKATLMQIDQVEEYISTGDYKAHIRILLNNPTEGVQDSFYFSVDEDMELSHAFIQTTEANQKLLNKEMMLIQDKSSLDNFIVEMAKQYYVGDLQYCEVQIL